jgi:hypothetical protein
MKQLVLFFFMFLGTSFGVLAQDVVVFGLVKDIDSGAPIDFVTVYQKGTSNAVETDANGKYRIVVPADQACQIVVSRIGYIETSASIPPMRSGAKRNVNIKLVPTSSDLEVVVRASKIEDVGMVKEEVVDLKLLPTASGNFESVLPSIALGVNAGSGGELSSQYNVRGGNYDENLVYVNDFEIFRPQLIRAGNQEGLSFPNIDLMRDLSFSSGGFEAKYGDKLSSVLDIRYKRPDDFAASVSGSFLGATAHIEGSKRLGSNSYNKFRYLLGARYKDTRYLLGSQDLQGEYTPSFTDIQTYLTYDFTQDIQLAFLGNYNDARYNFTPQSRSTTLGLFNEAIRFTTVFEGSQLDRFENGTTGLALTYIPEREKNPYFLKLLVSQYQSNESEAFDILGFYRLSEVETGLGADNFGQEVSLLGTGTDHNYVRNDLYSTVRNIQHRGGYEIGLRDDDERVSSHFIQWSAKIQTEDIDDRLNEWNRIDSVGYSLPYAQDAVILDYVLKTTNAINSTRFTSFLQNTYSLRAGDEHELKITAGARASYWSLNNQWLFSPRAQILYKPLTWSNEVSFKLAGGVYYQPPFYREMRRPDGTVNTNLKAQQSVHIVGGISYDFQWEKISRKPFRFIAEAYYKRLSDLVSYELDNVRIRYSGENDSEGYAYGIDMRINGEFVPGAESWVNLAFLSTKERLYGVQHQKSEIVDGEAQLVDTEYVPRPTDRFMTLNMFFQDYLPSNDRFKANVNLSIGSGLPFGRPEDNVVVRNPFRFRAYHRVDIGFGFLLWNESMASQKPNHPLRFTKNAWLSLEVFNLMEVANTASNTWIKATTNVEYAIPDNLTSRRINLRLKFDF